MKPYIVTPFGRISTFTIMLVCGVLVMFLLVHIKLRNDPSREKEEAFIFPKMVFCGMSGCFFAAVFDSVFKLRENGGFVLKGITFYGGLLGASITLLLILRLTKQRTQYTIKDWFSILTIPFIAFHVFGRIGCFLGGCCYGKVTDSFVGIHFPDIPEHGIYHGGMKCYPTQLFEAAALLVILAVVIKVKKKFQTYLLLYAVARFLIEFYRGDDRGYIFEQISPAQTISIVIVLSLLVIRFGSYLKSSRPVLWIGK